MSVYVIAVFLLATIFINAGNANECACARGDVHIRSGAGIGHTSLGVLIKGHCLRYKLKTVHVSKYPWANVDYNGKDGWISQNYLTLEPCTGSLAIHSSSATTSSVQLLGCPNIVTRSEWGARAPSSHISQLPGLPKYVFIHHGATAGCSTKEECIHKVRAYQNYHMDSHHWPDIGYSFVVGGDGNVYEARGWDKVGTHTANYNSVGLGICVVGNFMDHLPDQAALNAVQRLIKCGLDNGKVQTNYILRGHRDVGQTSCPGTKFYDLIRTWSHY